MDVHMWGFAAEEFPANDHVGPGFLKCVDNVLAVWFHIPSINSYNALKMSLARSFVDLRWQFLLRNLRFDQQKKLAHG